MFFASRDRKGSDPYVGWKVRLFFIGAILAAVGIAGNRSWLVVTAIIVLLAGVALRFLPANENDEPES